MPKRIAAFLMMIVFVIAAVPTFAQQREGESPIEEYKLEMLQSVGILKARSDYVSGVVTRLEGAEAVLSMLAVDCQNQRTESSFDDIEDFTLESAVAKAVCQYGIMCGDEGIFAPDAILTYYQAVKVILVTLGYGEYAQELGGYPHGYISAAKSVGLLDGMSIGGEEGITQDKFYKMLYNAASVPVLEIKKVGDGSREYTASAKKTFLELYHQIYYVTGKVQANDCTAIGQNEQLAKSYVQIDSEIYHEGGSAAGSYIGYQVEAYVREDREGKIVLWAQPQKKCKTVTVSAVDMEQYSWGDNLVVETDTKKKSYRISSVADIFYNGKYLNEVPKDFQLNPQNGYIEIIDNNSDGIYDCVRVYDYITFRVGRIDAEHKTVFDKFYSNIIDFSKEDNRISVEKAGSVSDFYEIKTGDVLLVATDAVTVSDNLRYIEESARIYHVIILTETVTTEVKKTSVSGGQQRITLEDVEYGVTEELTTLGQSGKTCELTLGHTYKFVIGKWGEIVDAEPCDTSEQYGYICSDALSGIFEEEYKIKFFDLSSGAILIKPVAKKPELNGENANFRSAMAAFRTNSDSIVGNEIVPQLFRYLTNGKGEIKYIDTWIYNESCENPTTSLRLSVKGENLAIRSGKYSMSNKFFMGENAKVLTVRAIKKDGVTTVPEKAGSFSVANREFASYWDTYNVEAYNCTPAGVSEMIVLHELIDYDQGSNIDIGGGMMFDSISQVWAEGETHLQLNGYTPNGPVELILEDDFLVKDWNSTTATFSKIDISDLQRGDIIKCENYSSKCIKVERVFSYISAQGFYNQYHYYSNNYKAEGQDHFAYGKAYAYENGAMRVTFNGELAPDKQTNYEILETAEQYVLVYDTQKDTIELSEPGGIMYAYQTNDVETASDVVYHTHDMRLSFIYAYK